MYENVLRNSCTEMFTALFVIAKTLKQSKYQPTDEWINKLCYIHTIEYYSANKRNKLFGYIYNTMDELLLYNDELKSQTKKEYVFV